MAGSEENRMKRSKGYPQPLGASYRGTILNLAVCAPKGTVCELLLYRKGEAQIDRILEMPEEDGIGEVRCLGLSEWKEEDYEYNYRINGTVVLDPAVREIAGHREFGTAWNVADHKVRGRFPEREYDWEDDRRPQIPYHEVIAYSLHVRGFTMHPSSRVRQRGTFRGVIEKLPYLKHLGINQIQCMPVYEFQEDMGNYQNYWGYGSGFYFAPKAAYAAGDSVQREFRDMVKACHQKGIEVVLEMPFTSEILPQTALECLRFYLLEYHVDGFVVNPYNVPWESLKADPILKGAKVMKKEERFQNHMRRFLKGDEGMVRTVIPEILHQTSEDDCCNYVTSHTGFTLCDLVSYDGKHNEANGERNQDGPDYNYSWNCGIEGPSRKRSVTALRKNQMRNAFLLLLLSQGTPCILAGDEFGNTQDGNNNVYCQDNETAWLNWNRQKGYADFWQFVRALIALRKEKPVFHQEQPLSGLDRTACGIPDVSYHGESAWQIPDAVVSRQLGVLYAWEHHFWFVAYNMHWEEHDFALPALPKGEKWYVIAGTEEIPEYPEELESFKKVRVKARHIVVLEAREKEGRKEEKRCGHSNIFAPLPDTNCL